MTNCIQPILKCGCTGDARHNCGLKSYARNQCMCACHYTVEQCQSLVSAYLRLIPPVAAFIRKELNAVTVKTPAVLRQETVIYMCGHERAVEKKLSSMALHYVKTNHCDDCKSVFPVEREE